MKPKLPPRDAAHHEDTELERNEAALAQNDAELRLRILYFVWLDG
jgi:hypothetical protein